MAEPLLGVDKHGLSTLARAWTPASMVTHTDGRDAMEAMADIIADALNPLADMEEYLPIILNPTRCLDQDLFRILELNGIDISGGAISFDKQRRLAILGPELRSWRGAFRSHRSVASALTAGPVIIRTWITYRFVLDESTLDMVLLFEGIEDETQIFVLGQGPSAPNFIQAELEDNLANLATPVLDTVEITPCWALTAWRNGVGTWVQLGSPVLVAAPDNVGELGEFEALDMGPEVDTTVLQIVASPTLAPEESLDETQWGTCWFKTANVPLGDFFEFHLYFDVASGDSYGLRVRAGNSGVTIHRYTAGSAGPPLGSLLVDLSSSLESDYHTVNFLVHKNAVKTRLRIIVDGNPSGWFDDLVLAGRPDGREGGIVLRTTAFTAGRLRVGALTFRKNE